MPTLGPSRYSSSAVILNGWAPSAIAPVVLTQRQVAYVDAQAVAISPDSGLHGLSSTEPAIAAGANVASVSPANALNIHTATLPTLTAKSSIAPANAANGNTATSPTIAARASVSVASAIGGHSATSPTVAAKASLTAANANHALSATAPTITARAQAVAVLPASVGNGAASTSPAIAARSSVAENDNLIEISSTAPIFTAAQRRALRKPSPKRIRRSADYGFMPFPSRHFT